MQNNDTMNNLKEAFWYLYSKTPIEKIRVKDITDKAGYNRGTFYIYFSDVYNVLETIENGIFEDMGKSPGSDERMNTEEIINSILEFFKKHEKYLVVLLGENGDSSFAAKFKEKISSIIFPFLIKETEYDSVEVGCLTEFFSSGLLGIIKKWLEDNNGVSEDSLLKIVYVFAGVIENTEFRRKFYENN